MDKKYYADGWRARCKNEPFDPNASADWQDGWNDRNEAPQEETVPV
jgi:hypothetical protein